MWGGIVVCAFLPHRVGRENECQPYDGSSSLPSLRDYRQGGRPAFGPVDSGEDQLKTLAKNIPEVKKWLEGKEIKKEIVVKGKLVSLVVA